MAPKLGVVRRLLLPIIVLISVAGERVAMHIVVTITVD